MTIRTLVGRQPVQRDPSADGRPQLDVERSSDPGSASARDGVSVTVVLTVQVDPEAWLQSYGPVETSVSEDVRRYVGGVVSGSEATRRGALVGVDVDCAPLPPTGDY